MKKLLLIALLFLTCTKDEQSQKELSLKNYITSNIFSLTETLNIARDVVYEDKQFISFNLTPELFNTRYFFGGRDYDIPSIQTAGLYYNYAKCYLVIESRDANGYIGEDSEDLVSYVTDFYTYELRRSATGLLFKAINNLSGKATSSNWTLSDQKALNNDIASRPSGICVTK